MKRYILPDGSRVYQIGDTIADYICFMIILALMICGVIGLFGWWILLSSVL